MMSRLVKHARSLAQAVEGAVAPLVAVAAVVILAAAGLSVDAGMLFVTRADLQKSVDAAALAGAQDIGTTGSSQQDALSAAIANHLSASELTYNGSATALSAGDAWRVSARRSVALAFIPLAGIASRVDVVASATAISSWPQASRAMPYAVWGGNPGGLHAGDTVAYRDNNWPSTVVIPDPKQCKGKGNGQKPCNPNWDVGSTNFKGFFHADSGLVSLGSSQWADDSKGGGNVGGQPVDELCQAQAASQPVTFPVVTSAVGPSGSNIAFTISYFVKVLLNPIPDCSGGQATGQTLTGRVVAQPFTSEGLPGGTPPPAGAPAERLLLLWK